MMLFDLVGDIGEVWDTPAFIAAFVWGAAFGWLAARMLGSRDRWRPVKAPEEPFTIAWLSVLLTAAFLIGLTISQTIAALYVGDPDWIRIVSRGLGPGLAAAIGVGVGNVVARWWLPRL